MNQVRLSRAHRCHRQKCSVVLRITSHRQQTGFSARTQLSPQLNRPVCDRGELWRHRERTQAQINNKRVCRLEAWKGENSGCLSKSQKVVVADPIRSIRRQPFVIGSRHLSFVINKYSRKRVEWKTTCTAIHCVIFPGDNSRLPIVPWVSLFYWAWKQNSEQSRSTF